MRYFRHFFESAVLKVINSCINFYDQHSTELEKTNLFATVFLYLRADVSLYKKTRVIFTCYISKRKYVVTFPSNISQLQ